MGENSRIALWRFLKQKAKYVANSRTTVDADALMQAQFASGYCLRAELYQTVKWADRDWRTGVDSVDRRAGRTLRCLGTVLLRLR